MKSELIEPIREVRYREDCVGPPDSSLKDWLRANDWKYNVWTDSPSTTHAPHDHPYSHRVLVRTGWIEFGVQGERYRLTPGDALDLPKRVTHEATSAPDTSTEYWLLQNNR
ncbi:MAG: cupin domain-containing protein [bacterium]